MIDLGVRLTSAKSASTGDHTKRFDEEYFNETRVQKIFEGNYPDSPPPESNDKFDDSKPLIVKVI